MKKITTTIISLLTIFLSVVLAYDSQACTIGVAHGSATQDGRPLLWQTYDWDNTINWRVLYVTIHDYNFIAAYDDLLPGSPGMGVNEHGLAIVCSGAGDLTPAPSGPNYPAIMKYALGSCKTIDEFQEYLDSTNITGRYTAANYALIDSTGAAALFEIGGYEYWKFDATTAPDGFIIRTNFSINGGGTSGTERFIRSSELISNFHSGDSLNYKSLIRYHMRDFSDGSSQPYPVPYQNQISPSVPYGYFPTLHSICHLKTTSAAVIQGTLPSENPELSVMWTMLGHPAAVMAIPLWPVGPPPSYANGYPSTPICNISKEIRAELFDCDTIPNGFIFINSYKLRDDEGDGLWSCSFSEEDILLDSAEVLLNEWRSLDSIPLAEMLAAQNALAEMGYNSLINSMGCLFGVGIENKTDNNEVKIYPNPVNDYLKISITQGLKINEIIIYNMMGQAIHRETLPDQTIDVSTLPSGLYVLEVVCGEKRFISKFIK